MSGAGPFTVMGYFASLCTRHRNAWRTPSARADGAGACFASVRFRRGCGKAIVSITVRNAALSWREPSKQHGSLSRKSVNARAARFMVFLLTKSAFTSIEPKFHTGSKRTSFPASSSARALVSLHAAIPSPVTGVVRLLR